MSVWLAAFLLTGCASLQPVADAPNLPELPNRKQIRVGPYVFVTDADIDKDHPLLKELERLPEQIRRELHLPTSNQIVHVYLFRDRDHYHRYMQANFRGLPPRRAFFMARPGEYGEELLVYTYWGDRIQEDLRHELTHAQLHGVLDEVPMWLDEGLAEFFEVPPRWDGLNHRHLPGLRQARHNSWKPNLDRLESITEVSDMNSGDYRECWAWVHFMLRGRPEAKKVLLDYLQALRRNPKPGRLRPQLVQAFASPEQSLLEHLDHLDAATQSLSNLR